MSVSSLLLPVFVQVFLTFATLFWMGLQRQRAFRSGTVKPQDVALRENRWPVEAQQAANSYMNEFEIPVLFYAVVAFILITSTNSIVFVILAWAFVLSRVVRSYVHLTSNIVPLRGMSFVVGVSALFAMWVIFALRVLATGA
jgi:hypothetical protein